MEKLKIMVVDDNTVNLATLEQELKDTYEVVPMMTGRRAIKYLYQNNVNLILLDVQMPIMDGIETLKEIRNLENGALIPVIFLTAKKDAATVLEGKKLGIIDYITKPFVPEDLRSRIEKAFKKLGVFPMEVDELHARIKEIRDVLADGRVRPAINMTDEVLGYQFEDEILGRVNNAKIKMEQDNVEGALEMLDRVISFLEHDLQQYVEKLPYISPSEASARVLYIQEDLKNYNIKGALDKIQDLREYRIDDYVATFLSQAETKLKEYDDVEAQKILENLMDEMNRVNKPVLGAMNGSQGEKSGGYRASKR